MILMIAVMKLIGLKSERFSAPGFCPMSISFSFFSTIKASLKR
jgi:hypothetical protein